jgi:Histone H1-like protein Hc1
MALKDSIQKLKDLIASTDEDAAKALTGNKAAAVRLRKAMQDVKDAAQQVRVDALAHGPTVQDVAAEQGRAVGGPGAEPFAPSNPERVDEVAE